MRDLKLFQCCYTGQ